MNDVVTEGVNDHLVEENRKLEQDLALAQATIQSQNNLLNMRTATDQQILTYLPQLTNLATNMSHVASAIQGSNNIAERQVKATSEQTELLRGIFKAVGAIKRPGLTPTYGNAPGPKICNCDGPAHDYTPGWCPAAGPKV